MGSEIKRWNITEIFSFNCDKLWQAKKYKELKKREDQMDDFLEKFEIHKMEEGESKKIHEENIVKLLETISTG